MEHLRKKLYKVIESGDKEKILVVSRELDKLILSYMKAQMAVKLSKI